MRTRTTVIAAVTFIAAAAAFAACADSITPPVQFAEAPDPMAPAFGGMAFAAAVFSLIGCLVLACATEIIF